MWMPFILGEDVLAEKYFTMVKRQVYLTKKATRAINCERPEVCSIDQVSYCLTGACLSISLCCLRNCGCEVLEKSIKHSHEKLARHSLGITCGNSVAPEKEQVF
ncbi:hypothetical protein E2542_SST21940 [Spatholobus suberectus]|nr:hypothetical protein E2542_SST21940 [Spatholobus suberectus]